MKKSGFILIILTIIMLTGCGNSEPAADASGSIPEETTETQMDESPADEDSSDTNDLLIASEAESTEPETTAEENDISVQTEAEITLPHYEYPGPEQFYYVLYKYITDTLSADYDKADVSIPSPVIVAEDYSNPDDIRVWGDFWIMNYDLKGNILEMVSGGSYPGVIHLKQGEAGYEVTGMEVVEDGSNFIESAKEIFGEHYDAFMEINADSEEKERIRAQIIANYVAANDLEITAYKDYGWDPVPLPEENIDNFYSVLD